jgi:phage terminase small subunit
MPGYLADDALAVAAWDRFATTLVDLKVLTTAHALPLALLAETAADLERMHEEWKTMGRKSVLVTSWIDAEKVTRHRIIANPLKRLYRAEKLLALQLASEFGLTPATASKVLTHDGEGDPAFDAFLQGPSKVLPFAPPKR